VQVRALEAGTTPGRAAMAEQVEVCLWVLDTVSPHASWRRPPIRSRRVTLMPASMGSGSCPQGAGLVQGPVRTMRIEVGLVFGEDFAAGVDDEDPVEEFAAYASHRVGAGNSATGCAVGFPVRQSGDARVEQDRELWRYDCSI
jgi:hypothetical protein